jgi:hypothetical protein
MVMVNLGTVCRELMVQPTGHFNQNLELRSDCAFLHTSWLALLNLTAPTLAICGLPSRATLTRLILGLDQMSGGAF